MTPKLPVDAPIESVVNTLEHLGFRVVRSGNHIALLRENEDGTRTPMTIPNHRRIKGSIFGKGHGGFALNGDHPPTSFRLESYLVGGNPTEGPLRPGLSRLGGH